MDLSSHDLLLRIYVSRTKVQRKIIIFLFHILVTLKRPVYPFISTIAEYAGCEPEYVSKFIAKYQKCEIFVKQRIARTNKKTGRRTSSLFILDENFVPVYKWLLQKGYLLSGKEKILKDWEASVKKTKIGYPSKPKLATPHPPFSIEEKKLHKDSLYKEIKETNKEKAAPPFKNSFGLIYNPLESIKLAIEAKILATRKFSEHIVIDAIEAFQYQKTRNRIKKSDEAYFIGICKIKSDLYERKKHDHP